MSPEALEAYLRREIPLAEALGVRAVPVGDGLALEAPLEPNRNHQATAFGGSVCALAILAGWAAVQLRLDDEGLRARTVIHENTVRYEAPITGAFRAAAQPIPAPSWSRLVRSLTRHGMGRVRVDVAVRCAGVPAARFSGSYVALGS